MVNHNADFFEQEQLEALGFRFLGSHVLIHRSVVLIRCENISIGNNVRIDPFCVISCGEAINIGHNVHIASHCSVSGNAVINLGDFCGLSKGVKVFSSSDDFSGPYLTGPTVPQEFCNVESSPVSIGRHAVVGSGSVVLPGSTLGEGTTVGAMGLVKNRLPDWTICSGIPAQPHRPRSEQVLDREIEYLSRKAAVEPKTPPHVR